MSGGGDNSSGMMRRTDFPVNYPTQGMQQFLPTPGTVNIPEAIPAYLQATADQLSAGYGNPASEILSQLQGLYSPMSVTALQYPISAYAAQSGSNYSTGDPMLDLLLNGKGITQNTGRGRGMPIERPAPSPFDYGGSQGMGQR